MAYTSDKEPSQLTALTTMDTADVFVIGDVSDASEVAKYITKANLMAAPGAIGGTTPAAGTFSGVTISASGNLDIGGITILDDTAGTTALQNIDSIDATTEATIEAAIDTLANLTSIQGRTVTLADAGANAIFGWDDTAGAYENLTQSEVKTIIGDAAADGSTKGVATFTASDFNATTGNISIDYTNGQKASTTQAGFLTEIAIASEVNTGTDPDRAVSPDALAGSNFGIRYVACDLNGTTALTTSEKCYFRIPAGMTGMNLVAVTGSVGTGSTGSSSSGTPTFTVRNVTDNQQMLSTSLTIDVGEYTSATAATPVVINGSFDDVVTDDLIEVAVTTAGTGVTYARVTLGFQLP